LDDMRPSAAMITAPSKPPGWALTQTQPGHMTWTTPSGRTYTTGPTSYPD